MYIVMKTFDYVFYNIDKRKPSFRVKFDLTLQHVITISKF